MKLKHDVALCFDWFVIDQCGLVAPFVESFGDGRKQAGRTEDLVYVFDVAVLGDGDGQRFLVLAQRRRAGLGQIDRHAHGQ